MTKGLIIAGEFGNIILRQKNNAGLELGELLVADTPEGKILLEVFDLLYGSQLADQQLELVSGLKLEEDATLDLMDKHLRTYVLARAKNLITITNNNGKASKVLPSFFSGIREVTADDLAFLAHKPANPLFLGNLRSGTKVIDVPIHLDGTKALSHHVLISGTTGRGKSVLMKSLLWHALESANTGFLVLDPHDEYYGRNGPGLKDHALARDKLLYYTPRAPPPGARTLKIRLSALEPRHFNGVIDWSDAQKQALYAYHKEYGSEWIEAIVTDKLPEHAKFVEGTIAVLKRVMLQLLGISVKDGVLDCKGVFDAQSGEATIAEIRDALENGRTVVVDTSECPGLVEILIGSILATELLERRRHAKHAGSTVSIVLEEAPRVLGKDVLERGPNIFGTIAREGRKFGVGLCAITQLPSLIPKEILANLNTKIILGVELKPERQALIESASQDLSSDERTIASLDKGEAIVTSSFLPFATPIKVPAPEEFMKAQKKAVPRAFSGITQ